MAVKKIKPVEFQLKEDVFNSAIYIIVNKSFDQMVADIKKRLPSFVLTDDKGGLNGLAFVHYEKKDDLTYNFIYLPKFEWTIHHQGILAHELLHIVFYLFSQKGVTVSVNDPNEAFCYFYEFYFDRIMTKLGKIYG